MCLSKSTSMLNLTPAKKQLYNKPTFVGWRFFTQGNDGQLYSPIRHSASCGYTLGETLVDDYAYSIQMYLPNGGYVDESYTTGFHIFPTKHEAKQAYRICHNFPYNSVLAKVRFAHVLSYGIDQSAQRCVVANVMVVDKVESLPYLTRIKQGLLFFDDVSTRLRTAIVMDELPYKEGGKTLVRRHKDGHLVFHPNLYR